MVHPPFFTVGGNIIRTATTSILHRAATRFQMSFFQFVLVWSCSLTAVVEALGLRVEDRLRPAPRGAIADVEVVEKSGVDAGILLIKVAVGVVVAVLCVLYLSDTALVEGCRRRKVGGMWFCSFQKGRRDAPQSGYSQGG